MKSTILILVFALAALAGVFSFNWGSVEGDFSMLEIRAKGAVLKTVEAEDGIFPESAEIIETYYVIPDGCVGCSICINQCPVDAITMDADVIAYIDPELCVNCGMCAGACPTGTIELLDKDDCDLYGVDADGNEELLQEGFEVE